MIFFAHRLSFFLYFNLFTQSVATFSNAINKVTQVLIGRKLAVASSHLSQNMLTSKAKIEQRDWPSLPDISEGHADIINKLKNIGRVGELWEM